MSKLKFSLDDKYTKLEGQVALNGIQAMVRIPIDQNRRDQEAGLRIGTYVTGYQGSPLGEFDKQMRLAGGVLKDYDVRFEPGINEDMAATAIYGSQYLDHFPHSRYDGILGMWYGKAPGLDRSGDILRHAQFVGSSRHGAALLFTGDDPSCKSSTLPTDSTVALFDLATPIFYPGNSQEVLEYGLHGAALSRYCGMWSAIKIVTNVADGGGTVEVYPDQAYPIIPELEIGGVPFEKKQDVVMLPPHNLDVERQIFYERLVAAQAYIRVNKLCRITVQSSSDRIGLVSSGKTYDDLMLALEMMGFREEDLKQAGIRVYKMGVLFPIEPVGLREFADGLEDIVVVEEKRGFLEMQLCQELYNHPGRPAVFGKNTPDGQPMFPMYDEYQPDQIARILAPYLAKKLNRPDVELRVKYLHEINERAYEPQTARTPYFCSGCPHNTSTQLPEGDLAGGGIGCHAMAAFMDRGVSWIPHMGGEGVPWLGLRHYTDKGHMFQNLGDGTYYHSGSKGIEAVIAENANMTFKILWNSTVAMTGGQDVVGGQDPISLAKKLELDGMKEIVIVPEDMSRYPQRRISKRITVRPKDDYNQVMLDLRKIPGVTGIIFDQQCAAQKRRKRKQGILETPRKRIYINEGVCEGCGDCGAKSNCLSVTPVETEYGRKTQIHQSSCNMDYSCLKGDCPAFMTVELGENTQPARRGGSAHGLDAGLPEPAHKATTTDPYKILMVGIGGTGVVTVDALLVTATTIEGKYAIHLDQTGLAQKGGSVHGNLIISDTPARRPSKIAMGEAHAVLAFDLLAATSPDNLNRYTPRRTTAVVNTHRTSTGENIVDVKSQFPAERKLIDRLNQYTRADSNIILDAEEITEALFGNNLSNNIFLVGVAYQAGLIPLRSESVEEAITINGVAVEQNLQAFRWGRKYQIDPGAVTALIAGEGEAASPLESALNKLRRFASGQVAAFEAMVARFPGGEALADILYPRVSDLILYQNAAYARSYLDTVGTVVEAEQQRTPGRTALGEATARWLFKLMAYKDEYEVARLWLQHPARESARGNYDGALKIYYNLHPPLLRAMGMKGKLRLGAWFTPVLGLLASMKGLRGGTFDPFRFASIRREERRLIGWYREMIAGLLPDLTLENHGIAVSIAECPDGIRGYEAVKERNIAEVNESVQELLAAYRQPESTQAAG